MSETYTPSPDNCLLGAGSLYLAVIDNTTLARGPYYHMGDVSEFNVQANDDVAEHNESMTEAQGLYASALRKRSVEANMTCWEWNMKNLALAFMGTESSYTQSATTTTETLTTSLALGATYFSTAGRNVTVTSITGGAALTVTTDYTLVDSSGLFGVTIVPTSTAATATSALVVIYTKPAITAGQQTILQMFNRSRIYCSIKFVGQPTAGPKYEAHYHKVSINPGQIGGFISDDFASFELTGKVLADLAGTYGGSTASPYGTLYRR
jgi:hypothetical protein